MKAIRPRPVALALALLLTAAAASGPALAAAKAGPDKGSSLLSKLRTGIEENNRELVRLLASPGTPSAIPPAPADEALLQRVRTVPGVRPEMVKMIELYQNQSIPPSRGQSVDTMLSLFAQLRTQLAKEHRERMTLFVIERLITENGTAPASRRPATL